jgi:transposase-like protein
MTKHIEDSVKDQVLLEIKNGTKVIDAATKYTISDKTIYGWMRKQADNTGTSSLEVAKLRRENQELKELIGIFALDKKRAEKNTRSA